MWAILREVAGLETAEALGRESRVDRFDLGPGLLVRRQAEERIVYLVDRGQRLRDVPVAKGILRAEAVDLHEQVNLVDYLPASEVRRGNEIEVGLDIGPPSPVVDIVIVGALTMGEEQSPCLMT